MVWLLGLLVEWAWVGGAGFLLGLISRDECELGFILRGLIGLELCRAVILHGLIVRGFVVLVVVWLLVVAGLLLVVVRVFGHPRLRVLRALYRWGLASLVSSPLSGVLGVQGLSSPGVWVHRGLISLVGLCPGALYRWLFIVLGLNGIVSSALRVLACGVNGAGLWVLRGFVSRD